MNSRPPPPPLHQEKQYQFSKRVRTEGLKLSVKVVHVVCDCRLDSSWIQNRQMVKFFNKKCRLNIFIFKCENHLQNLKCFTNLRSGILFSCISSWYCLPLMKPRLLLFVAFQNGTIAYWWRSATEDQKGVGNSYTLEDRLFTHHGCLAGPVIDIYYAVCIRTKAMRGTER